jgi:hypothetical protein
MANPDLKLVTIPAVAGGIGPEVRIDQIVPGDKGYDYVRDGAAAFTAQLEASVGGQNWTNILALGASGQGTIAGHYNHVRVNVTAAGALGATTKLLVGGVVQ